MLIKGTISRQGSLNIERGLEIFVSRTAQTLDKNVRKYTPKRSGKAAKSWRKTKTNKFAYNITNNQSYVPRLDDGYSRKAPNGFYQPAVRDTLRTNKGRFYK